MYWFYAMKFAHPDWVFAAQMLDLVWGNGWWQVNGAAWSAGVRSPKLITSIQPKRSWNVEWPLLRESIRGKSCNYSYIQHKIEPNVCFFKRKEIILKKGLQDRPNIGSNAVRVEWHIWMVKTLDRLLIKKLWV